MVNRLLLIITSVQLAAAAILRTYPAFDYGGRSHSEFLQDAIGRSSPGNARILAQLFGGLELGLDLSSTGGAEVVITIGGDATRCQHQSPCYDENCKLCYDPLLQIHGRCGGASYYTCRGTLPKNCLPYTCTAKAGGRTSDSEEVVLVKKFPRFQDPYCLGIEEKARSFSNYPLTRTEAARSLDSNSSTQVAGPMTIPVPDAVTPCQGYDVCLDLKCGKCYDPYLGLHSNSCGDLSHFDCEVFLPDECKPFRCTESDVKEIFLPDNEGRAAKEQGEPLMVRGFEPLKEAVLNCIYEDEGIPRNMVDDV